MSQSKVFIAQRPTFKNPLTGNYEDKFDLTPALMYGELIEILKPGNLSPNIRNLLPYMLQHMGTFTEDDYLLALGDPIAIAAAACIAVELTDGIVKMLKWDKISKTYIPFVIDLRYDDGDGEGGRVPSIGAVYGC